MLGGRALGGDDMTADGVASTGALVVGDALDAAEEVAEAEVVEGESALGVGPDATLVAGEALGGPSPVVPVRQR